MMESEVERLSFVDQFLFKIGESGLPALNMQGAMILDPSKGLCPVDALEIAEHIAARLSCFPVLRKRLVQDAFHIGDIKMVDDPDFNVWDHITFSTLPSPGSDLALARRLGRFSAELLDSRKPLWRFEIIEGLEGGKIAIVQKLSHAVMDGKAAMKIMQTLFDLEPKALDKLGVTQWPSSPLPSSVAMRADAVSETVSRLSNKAPKAIYQVSKYALNTGRGYLKKKIFNENERGDSAIRKTPVGRTSLNTEISNDRRNVAFISFDLARLKVLSKYYQCTMNDLCLLVATESMLNYFSAINEDIGYNLQLCMPVSTRSASSREHGNELKLATVNAHNTTADLVERIAKVKADTSATKMPKSPGALSTIDGENLAGSLFPLLIDMACAGLSFTKPWKHFPVLFNAVVTNIPGPLQPIYFCGMPVECQLPIIPMFHTGALAIGATSMGAHLTFGFHCCGRVVKEENMKFFPAGALATINYLEETMLTGKPASRVTRATNKKSTKMPVADTAPKQSNS